MMTKFREQMGDHCRSLEHIAEFSEFTYSHILPILEKDFGKSPADSETAELMLKTLSAIIGIARKESNLLLKELDSIAIEKSQSTEIDIPWE